MMVVTMAILLGMVTYLQRACLGSLEKPLMHDLDLAHTGLGIVLTPEQGWLWSTGPSRCLLHIRHPSARWADRVGTRIMLTAVVGCGRYDLHHWIGARFPVRDRHPISLRRGRIGGLAGHHADALPLDSLSRARHGARHRLDRRHITAGVTPLLGRRIDARRGVARFLLAAAESRPVLILFSFSGLIWAAVWYWWFRDEPGSTAGERARSCGRHAAGRTSPHGRDRATRPHGRAFWLRLLTHRNVLALCHVSAQQLHLLLLHHLVPQVLSEGRGMDGRTLAFFTGLPLLMSVAADLLGGDSDRLGRPPRRAALGPCGRGLGVLRGGDGRSMAGFIEDARLAARLFALGTAANMFLWRGLGDLPGYRRRTCRHGQRDDEHRRPIGAMTCPLLVIYLKDHYGWNMDLVHHRREFPSWLRSAGSLSGSPRESF